MRNQVSPSSRTSGHGRIIGFLLLSLFPECSVGNPAAPPAAKTSDSGGAGAAVVVGQASHVARHG